MVADRELVNANLTPIIDRAVASKRVSDPNPEKLSCGAVFLRVAN